MWVLVGGVGCVRESALSSTLPFPTLINEGFEVKVVGFLGCSLNVLVEQLTLNQRATGSIPVRPTN